MRNLIYDEQHPAPFQIGDIVESITFENPTAKKLVRPDEMVNAISQTIDVSKIRRLVVGMSSSLSDLCAFRVFSQVEDLEIRNDLVMTLSPLPELANLRNLTIGSSKPSGRCLDAICELRLRSLHIDVAHEAEMALIGRCSSLERLVLRNSPARDLRDLSSLRLKELGIGKGLLESTEGIEGMDLDKSELALCRKLTRLTGLSSRYLDIECCPSLGSNCMEDLATTQRLRIIRQGTMESVDFVRSLHNLAHLVIDATQVSSPDIMPLGESRSLRTAWLPRKSFSESSIKSASKQNERLVITNGKATYQGGNKIDIQCYYDALAQNG